MNTYKIIFTRENGTQGTDHFTAINERQARKDFGECYRHSTATIISIELASTNTPATKQQERDTLEKIRKMVEQLGPDSYLATAFEGCFAGWADQGNTNPILRAFIEWCDALAATKERRTHNNDPLQVLFQLSRLPAGHSDRLRALLDRRQVRHRGRGGPHLPRPLHRRVRIVLYHP